MTDPVHSLARKIADRTCRYGVIGLGYVGLPLAIAFTKKGVHVVGFEVDGSKVKAINAGSSYIPDVPAADVAAARKAGRLEATTDFARLAECDVISICVPTPLSKSRDPDVSYVAAATESVRKALRPGQLVVLESTTYPGMTEEFLRPPLEKAGLVVGRDIGIAFSPERVDPGNPKYGVENTPKVVGGCEAVSTKLAADFYRIAVDTVVEVSSAAAAEMAKLLENTFRSVNIALVNEVAIMCDRLGLDVREVVNAAASKPFGFMAFQPGPGTGGHCIPLDPLYLSWKLRTLEYRARFVELSDDVNLGMPRYVVERAATALNEVRKSLKGSRVLVLGVAYKRDVDDVRESPSLEIIRHLKRGGAEVDYSDPHIPVADVHGVAMTSVKVDAKSLATYDCVVVATDHRAFPWGDIARHASLIVDSRGAVPRDQVRGTLLPLSGPAVRGTAAPSAVASPDRPSPDRPTPSRAPVGTPADRAKGPASDPKSPAPKSLAKSSAPKFPRQGSGRSKGLTGLGAALRAGLSIAWRHRWVFGVPIATILLPAALYVVHLPDVYKAVGSVSVRAVTTDRVAGGGPQETRPEQILATARDRLLAAPNVEAIVPLLYPGANPKDAAVIAKTRARVSYDQVGESAGFNASIEDKGPARAAAAVNKLLETFIDGERESRLALARSSLAFAEKQLAEATATFDAARGALDEFRRAHPGTMPEDRETVAGELSRVETEVRDLESRAASSRRLMNEYELMLRRPAAAQAPSTPGSQMTAEEFQLQTALSAQQQLLDKAKQNLAEMRAKYQEKWPGVVAARGEVEQLTSTVADTTRRFEDAHQRAEKSASARRTNENQGAVEFYAKARKEEADAEQRYLNEAQRRLEEKAALERKLAEIPATAGALVTVRQSIDGAQHFLGVRDQSVQAARQQVDALSQPDLASTLLGFRIESPARPPSPDNPSGPARMRWLAMAIALGAAFGYGLVFLRARFDEGVIENPSDLATLLPGALVVAVPLYGEGRASREGRRVRGDDWICGAWVLLCGAVTIAVLAWHKGWLEVPVWFRPWLGNA